MQIISNGAVLKSLTISPIMSQVIELPELNPPIAEFTTSGINLSWETSYFPSNTYEIMRKRSLNDYISIGNPSTTEWTDIQIPPAASSACYVVRYTDECSNQSKISEEVCLHLVGYLKLPNAFTPNGDNINNVLEPIEGLFDNFSVLICNRWGMPFSKQQIRRKAGTV